MSCEFHSKQFVDFDEEVNKLADRFARLSLHDDDDLLNLGIFDNLDDKLEQYIVYTASEIEPPFSKRSALNENEIQQNNEFNHFFVEDNFYNNNENVHMDCLQPSNQLICCNLSKHFSTTSEVEMVELLIESETPSNSLSATDASNLVSDIDKLVPNAHDTYTSSLSNKTCKVEINNLPETFIGSNICDISKNGVSSFVNVPKDFSLQDELHAHDPSKNYIIQSKYYAIALPKETEYLNDPNTLVYTELKDVLITMKSYKGSRFKEFSERKDAVRFASQRIENTLPKPKAEDDGSTFRSATSQELCQLRKTIEKGDEIGFVGSVWSNPKLLVGSCDTPSIMQEGMRYNALHVAAKCNKPFMCQLLLDTIENPKFLQLIYPLKNAVEQQKIVRRLVDLYLNTPDKKTGDTPLHYASKFGCLDCVKVLLAHPLCVPDQRNVAGFTPREIICSRLQPKSASLVEDIEGVFKGLVYIPVLRSEENDVPPVIEKPCTCKEIIKSTQGSEIMDSTSTMSLKAFVGPMAPEIAEQFYLVLKKPSSSQVFFYNPEELKLISKIRFSNREKGLERIGRWLAKDLKVPWNEYFPFLNIFTNLALDEGLKILEEHLKQSQTVPHKTEEEKSIFLIHQYPSHINPLAHYVNVQLERQKDIAPKLVEEFCTPPSSPIKNSDVDCFLTPPGSPSDCLDECFLQGAALSKLDVDVLDVVGNVPVNGQQFPNVLRWKSFVQKKLSTPEKRKDPHISSLNLITSVTLPQLNLNEKICTPRRTLLNKAFCIENT